MTQNKDILTLRIHIDHLSALNVLLNNKHNRQVEIPTGMSVNLDDLHSEIKRKLNEADYPMSETERLNMLCTIVGHLSMGNSVFDLIEMLVPEDEILERYTDIATEISAAHAAHADEYETTVDEELRDCLETGKQHYNDRGSLIDG